MKKLHLAIILITVSCFSCHSQRKIDVRCQQEALKFIQRLDDIDLSLIIGFSADTRGMDAYGNRYLRPLEYTRRDRSTIVLPSLQKTELDSMPSLSGYDYLEFAREFNIDESHAEDYVFQRINFIVNIFQQEILLRIHSQLFLGDFIEFVIFPGCSVWYKPDTAYLNSTYNELFSNAIKLQHNWYILPKSSIKLINGQPPIIRD